MEKSRRKKNRLTGYNYGENGAYFVTICVKDRESLLWSKPYVGATIGRPQNTTDLSHYGNIVDKSIQNISNFYSQVSVDKYVIMPNHLHLVLQLHKPFGSAMRSPTIATIVNQMKGYVTKQIGFSIWQKSYHDHIIRNQNDYNKIWLYIDQNPLKWKDDCYYTISMEGNDKMKKIQVGVIGATGYAGAELCRLIISHPQAELAAISSVSFEGQTLSSVYPAYYGLCDMVCENQEEVIDKSDVIFAALPHGLSQDLAAECDKLNKVFIDLGADFRLEDEETYKSWYGCEFTDKKLHEKSVYGLPELFRDEIKGKKIIANPGCYTTAVPLALIPALKNNLISTHGIIADCKSGVTGAGRKPSQNTHYPDLNEGFSAYKVANHRHTPEIEQTLSKIQGEKVNVTFVPHLLPVNRGILATCYGRLNEGVTEEMLWNAYHKAYHNEFFVRLLPKGKVADIHNIKYTNFCDVSIFIDEHTRTFIAISAIDNMVKGAAGQAIQNMNIAFDIDEKTGLDAVPPAF